MFKVFGVSAIVTAIAVLTNTAALAGTRTLPVPEPSVVALMATGIGVLMVAKFRKRK